MEALELVRYRGAGEVLGTLLEFPRRQFTVSELARVSKVPFSSVWRLVRKLEPAGVVEAGRVGKSVTVRLRESAYTKRVAELLKLSASPQAFTVEKLKESLRKTAGVREVFLFGSVARGEEKLESDIDLAMLVGKSFDANRLVFDAYEKYGTKVVPLTFHSRKELAEFLQGKEKVRLV